jgi:hypothetical protein
MLLFIIQDTTAVFFHVSAVYCNFSYGNCQHVWEDNIKMDLQDVESGDMDWVEVAQDRDRLRALVNGSRWLRIGTGCGHL